MAKAPSLCPQPQKQPLGQVNGLTVEGVSGPDVRDNCICDFALGSNDKADPEAVPPGEIWVEKTGDPQDMRQIALHELVERANMSKGDNYRTAHVKATKAEAKDRGSPVLGGGMRQPKVAGALYFHAKQAEIDPAGAQAIVDDYRKVYGETAAKTLAAHMSRVALAGHK